MEISSVKNEHELSAVLCYDEPQAMDSAKEFWRDWFCNRIKGEKFTLVAAEYDCTSGARELVGVVRLWKSPYCGNKWLVEGLEVIAPKRKRGIGKTLVKEAAKLLACRNVDSIHVQIHKTNVASIALHQSLGFQKPSTGTLNSYGEYREHSDEYVYSNL